MAHSSLADRGGAGGQSPVPLDRLRETPPAKQTLERQALYSWPTPPWLTVAARAGSLPFRSTACVGRTDSLTLSLDPQISIGLETTP